MRAAVTDSAGEHKKPDQVCFRVGNLYQSARHELEEVAAAERKMSKQAKQVVNEIVKDGKSLPSFCGDDEVVKADPGYEQVPKGDLARLEKELANMERRTRELLKK